jgi:hypothetical protein
LHIGGAPEIDRYESGDVVAAIIVQPPLLRLVAGESATLAAYNSAVSGPSE